MKPEPEPEPEPVTTVNYEKLYHNLVQELRNVVYDIDGETAIKMIKNIRRMLNSDNQPLPLGVLDEA